MKKVMMLVIGKAKDIRLGAIDYNNYLLQIGYTDKLLKTIEPEINSACGGVWLRKRFI